MHEITNDQVDSVIAAARSAAREERARYALCVVDARRARPRRLAGRRGLHRRRCVSRNQGPHGDPLQRRHRPIPLDSPVVTALVSSQPSPVNLLPGGVLLSDDGRLMGAIGVGGSDDPLDDVRVATAARAALPPRAT